MISTANRRKNDEEGMISQCNGIGNTELGNGVQQYLEQTTQDDDSGSSIP